MTSVRRLLLPGTVLARLRLAALVFAVATPLSQLAVEGGAHTATPAQQARAAAALALLVVLFVVTYVRRRASLVEVAAVGPLLLVAGISIFDPLAVIGLCLGALVHQSLYGGTRAAVLQTVAVTAAYLLTIVLSAEASRRGLEWHSGVVLSNLPSVAGAAAVMRVLHSALLSHEATAARDALLARTATALLGQTDKHAIRRIAAQAGAELCALQPGVGALRVRVDPDAVVVENSSGVLRFARGARLAPACVAALDPRDEAVQRLDVGTDVLDRLARRTMHWSAMRLGAPDATRYLLIGAAKPLPDDVVAAHRVLAAQVSLAEESGAAHRQLMHEANHDHVTGLPNRTAIYKLLADAIDDPASTGVTVLHMDVDDFKAVNDTYGHVAGDELLAEVARRLLTAAGEAGRPARVGGDEFLLVLPDVRDRAGAERVAAQVLAALAEPVRLHDATLAVTASIGIAHHAPGMTAGDLVRCADIAMYTAKRQGKHRFEHFDPAQHGRIERMRRLEEHLPHALERDEILVHYQPQVDLRSGRCLGVEALARWRHPRLGMVGPSEFIPVAERTGAIDAIGAYVLRTACAQAAAWLQVAGLQDLRLAVNVAARQLARDSFADTVREALAVAGLPAAHLTLELTESELIEGALGAEQLTRLAALGVRISIDDFGTGYASLAYLRTLPVHQVKIDRSFVSSPGADADGAQTLARAVLLVGQTLGLETIAEGVERSEQAAALGTAGVEIAQGYLFARPMPAEHFAEWAAATGGVVGAAVG